MFVLSLRVVPRASSIKNTVIKPIRIAFRANTNTLLVGPRPTCSFVNDPSRSNSAYAESNHPRADAAAQSSSKRSL